MAMMQYMALIKNCAEGQQDSACLTELPGVTADSNTLVTALSIVFGVIGAVAVIIIVLQGIKFMLSSGEPEKAANARKAVIYAVVGLVVAVSAEVVVRVVIGKL